jgi:4-amino-4-deoxy-L-arabinose transferase-like glycosyltransferase
MWAAATERRSRAGFRGLWTVAPIDHAIALLLAAAALGLGLLKLPGTSLWGDEVFSVQLVGTSWPVFWQFVSTHEANMILYHLVLRGWLGLTGALGLNPDELIVRIPSIVFGAGAAVIVYAIGRRWWGRTVGIVGAVLVILNALQLLAAREARSYSLEVFLVCFGWYALFAAVTADRHPRRWWSAFALAMALALYAHLFSALVVAGQAFAFVVLLALRTEWGADARRSIRAAIASFGAIGLAALPLVAYTLRHGPTNPQIGPAGITEIARLVWNVAGHDVVFGIVLGVSVAIGIALTVRQARRSAEERTLALAPAVALACWLIVPIVLSYAATQPRFNLHLFAWGYLVVVVPALCLFAAIGVIAVRNRILRVAIAVALVAGAAVATPEYSTPPSQDFRAASAWIAERYRPGDGLVATSWSSTLGMTYYSRLGVLSSDLVTGSPAPWSWPDGGAIPLDMQAVESYVAQHPRVFLVDSLLAGDAAAVKAQARDAEAWLGANYRILSEVAVRSSLGPVRVRLYEPR